METYAIAPGSVVVGVDGSEHGDRALLWASDLAALDRRPLALTHALGSLGTPGTVWLSERQTDRGVALEEMHAHGEQILTAAAERVRARYPSVPVDTLAVADDPRQLLLGLAERATTVVVGSRGLGPVRSLLLGSVSLAVARHASCPVVVVRPHNPGSVRRGVLVGADGTPESRATLEFAYHQAAVRRLPLTVVHAVWDVVATTAGAHVVPPSEEGIEEARAILTESVAGLAEKYPDVRADLQLARGLPDDVLVRASERMDLLVIGRHQRTFLGRALRGDVAAAVVEHATCAVAVVPETTGPATVGADD